MIKFYIEFGNNIKQHTLQYLEDECSFYMGLPIYQSELELTINKIDLWVNHNFIVNVGGFCGYKEWIKTDILVPEFKEGILKVEHDLEFGFAYCISEKEWPVYVNNKIGWVCFGDPYANRVAVEFIDNCVAVINDKQEFVALWLKPVTLPNL